MYRQRISDPGFDREMHRRVLHADDKRGYSKAVDIWAVGSVTACLFTNKVIFGSIGEEHVHPSSICDSNATTEQYDLAMLDNDDQWLSTSPNARSFVRQCLAADEVERLTAEEALLHPWFSNRHYSDELKLAYQRAVGGWRPRQTNEDVVRRIDTTHTVKAALERPQNGRPLQATSSHFFPTDSPRVPPIPSSTPSLDPAKHAHTSLSQIAGDSTVSINRSGTPQVTANAPRKDQLGGGRRPIGDSFAELSITDLASRAPRPAAHLAFSQSSIPPPPPMSWDDSLAQSMELDPHLPSRVDRPQ